MIFSFDPIDLDALRGALILLAELDYLHLPPGAHIADAAPDALAQARRDFVRHIQDNVEQENAVRRALAWLLNQDDERLARFGAASLMPFPVADLRQRRQFLESLWAAAFADWRQQGVRVKDLEIQGPGA